MSRERRTPIFITLGLAAAVAVPGQLGTPISTEGDVAGDTPLAAGALPPEPADLRPPAQYRVISLIEGWLEDA